MSVMLMPSKRVFHQLLRDKLISLYCLSSYKIPLMIIPFFRACVRNFAL